MITKSKRQKKRKSKEGMVFQAIFFFMIFFVIFFLVFSIFNIIRKRTELTKEIESLQKEIENLEDEKQALETGISETEEESYWEEKAREQGYIKEGENPVVVIPPAETQKQASVRNESFSEMFLQGIKDLLAKITQW